jgi:Family of unknown function (DUF6272)
MNIEIFKGYRQFVTEQGVLFYYDGYLSQPIITAMSEALRGKLEVEDSPNRATRKVFSTFVEMMQNIVHYADGSSAADNGTAPLPCGNVAVGRKNDRYYIVSGNTVATRHIERLQAKLEGIRAMSADEIKAEYKRKLRTDEQDANSQGAGLGFLTVARDASEPIEFLFEPIAGSGNALSFFYLKATV